MLTDNAANVEDYSTVFDTLAFARKKHPGQRNSLDALCRRYAIDNSHRELHGALLDAEILADVFLLMTGGQSSLLDEGDAARQESGNSHKPKQLASNRPALAIIYCGEKELAEHQGHAWILLKNPVAFVYGNNNLRIRDLLWRSNPEEANTN